MKLTRWLLWRRLAVGFIFLAVLFAFAACGDEEGEEKPSGGFKFDGRILVGYVDHITGAGSYPTWAESEIVGMQTAMQEINDTGGVVVGGKRYRLELKTADGRVEPVAIVAGTQEMIGEKAIAILAPYFLYQLVYEQARAANVITFTQSFAAIDLLEREGVKNHPLLFNVNTGPVGSYEGWVRQIVKLFPNIKSVGAIQPDQPEGRAQEAALKSIVDKLGLRYVQPRYYPFGTTDFSTFITSLKQGNPDLVYFGGPEAVPALDQMADLKVAPYIWGTVIEPRDVPTLGDLGGATVIIGGVRVNFEKKLIPQKFAKVAQKFPDLPRGGEVIAQGALAFYDYIYLLRGAIEKAQTVTDTSAIAKALEGMSYDGPFGKVTMKENHETVTPIGLVVATARDTSLYIYESAADDTPIAQVTVSRSQVTVPR